MTHETIDWSERVEWLKARTGRYDVLLARLRDRTDGLLEVFKKAASGASARISLTGVRSLDDLLLMQVSENEATLKRLSELLNAQPEAVVPDLFTFTGWLRNLYKIAQGDQIAKTNHPDVAEAVKELTAALQACLRSLNADAAAVFAVNAGVNNPLPSPLHTALRRMLMARE